MNRDYGEASFAKITGLFMRIILSKMLIEL